MTNHDKFRMPSLQFLIAAILFGRTAARNYADNFADHFTDFKAKFQISYSNSKEEAYRLNIFQKSMQTVDALNEVNGAEVFGVTKYSDRTSDEFSVLLGGKYDGVNPQYLGSKRSDIFEGSSLPTYVNWVDAGVVTPVKDQGQCGTCWAFSAAEVVESQWAINGNRLWEFSPQQIASCTSTCYGCGGGMPYLAIEYLNTSLGLASAWLSPYVQSMYETCVDQSCTEICENVNADEVQAKLALAGPYARVTGYEWAVPPCFGACDNQDLDLLAQNIATYGPASVCVDASRWSDYSGGVLGASACGGSSIEDIDHCVLLVGYNNGADVEKPYWIVKNTWSTDWGEDGYIYLEYGENTCGLANMAMFVTIGNGENADNTFDYPTLAPTAEPTRSQTKTGMPSLAPYEAFVPTQHPSEEVIRNPSHAAHDVTLRPTKHGASLEGDVDYVKKTMPSADSSTEEAQTLVGKPIMERFFDFAVSGIITLNPTPPLKNEVTLNPTPPLKGERTLNPTPPLKGEITLNPTSPLKNEVTLNPTPTPRTLHPLSTKTLHPTVIRSLHPVVSPTTTAQPTEEVIVASSAPSEEQSSWFTYITFSPLQANKNKIASSAMKQGGYEDNYRTHFETFKKLFRVSYESDDEEERRSLIFRKNMKYADEKNDINGAEVFGVTKFSDRTTEEFEILLGAKDMGVKPKYTKVKESTLYDPSADHFTVNSPTLPQYVNWVDKGMVTPVKNQGQCGSCWAFSATELVESQWAMNGNPLWEFSPQQILSCTGSCRGCAGGEPHLALEYVNSTTGLAAAWFAPYTQSMYESCSDINCLKSCDTLNVSLIGDDTVNRYSGPYATVIGYEWSVPYCTDACDNQDLNLLAANLIEHGPASVCLDASSWFAYSGGVLTQEACGGYSYDDINHCVQLVGYNNQTSPGYWIVKNTWATDWGEQGYIYLEFDKNTCGIANQALYVTLGNSQSDFSL